MSGSKQKNSSDVAGTAKKHQEITMETKMKIIEKVEQGEKMADIAHSYNMNYLTRHDSKKQKQDEMKSEEERTFILEGLKVLKF